jgi:hypothetical protein
MQIDLSNDESFATSYRLSSFGRPDGGTLHQYTFCPADLDGDGELTIFDFLAFQNAFDAGCP